MHGFNKKEYLIPKRRMLKLKNNTSLFLFLFRVIKYGHLGDRGALVLQQRVVVDNLEQEAVRHVVVHQLVVLEIAVNHGIAIPKNIQVNYQQCYGFFDVFEITFIYNIFTWIDRC